MPRLGMSERGRLLPMDVACSRLVPAVQVPRPTHRAGWSQPLCSGLLAVPVVRHLARPRTLSRARVQLRAGRSCEPLLRWLKDLPDVEGLDKLRIRQSAYADGGLGVFAARSFEAGELVCKVPSQALLMPGGDADAESLATALLQEYQDADSRFQPYFQSLPDKIDLAPLHPLLWPKELQQAEYLAELFDGSALAHHIFSARLNRRGASADEMWALAVVDSRSFNLATADGEAVRALVPFIDLFNNFLPLSSGASSWNCVFRGTIESGALLQAECPVQEGEELVHLYDELSTAALWATYGFVPEEDIDNPFEAPLITVPLNKEQRRLKLDLEDRHWLDEQTLGFEIPWDAEEGGPLLPALCQLQNESLHAASRQLQAQELLRQRLEETLACSLRSEERLLQPASEPHAAFKARLQRAARRLLRNERPLLEDELSFMDS
ncbi:unnamed protein product [Effrenium voratum]|nr:unnamed protein product [Effrenium voratum]